MAATKFPTPPQKQKDSWTFPNDLVQSNRRFYTQINFVDYNQTVGTSWSGALSMGTTIKLPIPKKLNDQEFNMWQEWSGRDEALALIGRNRSGGFLASMEFASKSVSTAFGATINPFMFLMYQRPAFKEHTFIWTLAPNTLEESNTIKNIVKTFKKAALPTPIGGTGGVLMKYPKLAMVKFFPDDSYLYKVKPCAIVSVQVDYNGSGPPSFFKSGAPTVVNLVLQLKEIQLWNTDNYDQ